MDASERSGATFLQDPPPDPEQFSDHPASAAIRSALGTISRAAESTAPVLLRGETGTGKTLLAEFLRAESARRARSFVVFNCPTLSEESLTKELNLAAHPEGTFDDYPGGQQRINSGNGPGGTLFFDEIGEMPVGLQAKLLKCLDNRRCERIGEREAGHSKVPVIRIVAATNRNIEDDVAAGRFRQDLFFRLNVIELWIPPLRERPEDILPLARYFVELFSIQSGRTPVPRLSERAVDLLCSYSWPGNVRELRNTIERAVTLWPNDVIEPDALPERLTGTTRTRPFIGGDYALEEIEQEHILRVVNRSPTLEKAAAMLGIDYTTLWRKRKRLGDGAVTWRALSDRARALDGKRKESLRGGGT